MIHPRLAARSLLKTPLVAAVAVLSLALGIGATAAIFAIFEQLVLRPLPVPHPEELVSFLGPGPKGGAMSSSTAGGSDAIFSNPMFRDLEREQTSFTGIAAHCLFPANLAYDGDTMTGGGALVSGSYFPVLELEPALGRLLTPDDDRVAQGQPLVVLSYAYWQSRFSGSGAVLNRTLVVNGQPLTIVGVAPPGFSGTTLGRVPEVFVPLSMRDLMVPGWKAYEDRRSYWAYLFARLRPGVSAEQATTAINIPYQALLREVDAPLQKGFSDQTMERFLSKEIVLEPGRRGQSVVSKESKAPLLQLLAVTGLVLLIACANIANLLLNRASDRSGEIALRLSIGARRSQLIAQLLTESFLLALAGGSLGVLVARGTLSWMLSILPADQTAAFKFSLGPATFLFLAVLSAVTGLVGLFPALHSTRTDLVGALKSQAGRVSHTRRANRFRAVMTALQIALSMALLISAGLFSRSLYNVSRVDLGIDIDRLTTFGLSPRLNGYEPAASRSLFERTEEALRAIPGVEMVTASMVPLISGSNWTTNITVQGYPEDPDLDTNVGFNEVGPDYFRTLGIPLVAGREIEARDVLGAPKVAVVNEAFVRKFDLGRDAVGKRMSVGSGRELDIEIVGLVQDTKYSEVKQPVLALFYLPYRQDDNLGSINFYVRSGVDPETLVPSLRRAVAELDRNLPIEDLRTMADQVRKNVFLDRLLSFLSASFAVLATMLAAVGLYGVVAYAVAQRTREIGLRMALGADRQGVRGLVLRQVAWLVVPGALLGVGAAMGLGRVAQSLLFEMQGDDPIVFLIAVLLLGVVAFCAGMVPAHRATRIDPMLALRNE